MRDWWRWWRSACLVCVDGRVDVGACGCGWVSMGDVVSSATSATYRHFNRSSDRSIDRPALIENGRRARMKSQSIDKYTKALSPHTLAQRGGRPIIRQRTQEILLPRPFLCLFLLGNARGSTPRPTSRARIRTARPHIYTSVQAQSPAFSTAPKAAVGKGPIIVKRRGRIY